MTTKIEKIDLKIEKREKPSQKAYREIEKLFGGRDELFKFIIQETDKTKTFLYEGREVRFVKSNIDLEEMTVWAIDETGWDENLTTFRVDMAKKDIEMFDWKDYFESAPNSDAKEFTEFLKQLVTTDTKDFKRK